MREHFREQLQKEMTRGQFLQVMAGLLLAVFGVHNLLAFFSSEQNAARSSDSSALDQSFGSRRFGK